MINDLNYAVTFPINGVSLSGRHTFQPGITAVSGKNGSGKSFGYSEVIRYGLFGKKALRGPAADYKQLDMSLSFTVAGKEYRVSRGKKQLLKNGEGEQLAVGAEAVDKKIVEILGFGLEVFDVVCAANQKESERLTKLTPTKRKELIDDVVGLTAQEAVEKACRDEAKGLRREAEALSTALVVPTEPEKPEGYRPSAEIGVELEATKALVERRAALQRTVDAVGEAPAAPADAKVDIAEIEEHEQKRVAAEAHRVAVERQLAGIPTTEYTAEQLDAAEDALEYAAEVKRRGPQPATDNRAEVEAQIEQWNLYNALKDQERHEATCPKCDHSFLTGLPVPEKPETPLSTLRAELKAHEAWAEPIEITLRRAPDLTLAEVRRAQAALEQAPLRDQLLEELAAAEVLADRSAELKRGREINQQWVIYERELAAYDVRHEASITADAELITLPEPKHSVAELDAAFVAAKVYESQLEAYAQQKARFDELAAQIAEKQERADGFAAGAKGLVEARRTLKAYLAPSLSRVASALIDQMTVNALPHLREIAVDEDMNITADGQDVSTFNGAHATMINLALRLALGQVLVSRVFPLFIGDEIDSDADADNSQAIADALGTLKDQLKQIVLISHKRLENVDHEVVLS